MERQLERRREPEPVVYERNIEETWRARREQTKVVASLPHVIQYSQVTWKQGGQAYRKGFTPSLLSQRFTRVPLYTLTLVEQILAPGLKSGKHRHFQEALFYIMEGEGYEVHDNVKYPWEAGDLMCVPTYCIHQHFNASAERPARLFFSVPLAFQLCGIWFVEQIEMHGNYQPPEGSRLLYGSQGEVIGYRSPDGEEVNFGAVDLSLQKEMESRKELPSITRPRNTYEHYLKNMVDQTKWRQSIPHVVKGKELFWENTPMGRLKYFLSPYKPGPLLLYDAFIQELPPGGRSGQHRHVSEEVHKILTGKGYDTHDGQRWDWEAEDIVIIPVNTVHQHFNADPHRPASFLSLQSRLYHYLGHGGIEHLEDAPDYKG